MEYLGINVFPFLLIYGRFPNCRVKILCDQATDLASHSQFKF